MSAQLAESHYRTNLKGEVVTIEDRYLRVKNVVEKCGISRAQIYNLMNTTKHIKYKHNSFVKINYRNII